MVKYNPSKIEKRWQKYWQAKKIYVAPNDSAKTKKYILVEFPYPSGEGLHMGHLRPYVAGDVYNRFQRMKGFNTMYPIGWDAFGLPAENYAIKQGVNPKDSTEKNIKNAKKQLIEWGMGFDWSREINTTDPDYYKWTQWLFLQFYKAGLAYEATGLINWCPKDKTGLANEEVIDGCCERCGTPVIKKEMRQWYLKITAYAEKLLEGLKTLNWPEPIKIQQANWIGRSEGAEITFKLADKNEEVKVFTTRPDTLFGATFLVISPELGEKWLKAGWQLNEGSEAYINESLVKSEQQRTIDTKEKTGVFSGIYAINPANKEKIPVWIADYILGSYGTGAIMAVPAHDERDFEFARKFKLPIVGVVAPKFMTGTIPVDVNPVDYLKDYISKISAGQILFVGHGRLMNSGKFSGMESEKAKWEITKFVGGEKKIQYKLRDWVFSRQRYWGEPIPIIHCDKCGTIPVPEKDLPVKLPPVEKYEPTGTGESPLAAIENWVNVKCPQCGGPAKRETNTMPQWAGSSWYYLRYCDSDNKKEFAGRDKMEYWLPVDVYFGGMEHTTLHLLYSRFWHEFLYDQKLVPTSEPYAIRVPHGIVLGPDGEKMSKSRGNVINPQDVVDQYGADALRMYELFLGPHEATVSWKTEGIIGVYRFLNRVWNMYHKETEDNQSESKVLKIKLNQAIKNITQDIQTFNFNTCVSEFMKLLNEMEKEESLSGETKKVFLLLLAPFAPYLAEELWQEILGNKNSIHLESWPEYDETFLQEEKIKLVIQVNGKVREIIEVKKGLSEEEIRKIATESPKVQKFLEGRSIKKFVYVPDKIANVVV